VVELLDERTSISIVELTSSLHIDRGQVLEMVEVGLLEPRGSDIEHWRFPGNQVPRARSAWRLVSDLGVNVAGAALVLDLIEQRDNLLSRIRMLESALDDS
jgi:chaperone modulatory protein CbpM